MARHRQRRDRRRASTRATSISTEALKPQPPKAAPAKPFWDEYPSIGNAELGLTLEVRRFAVKNNLAPGDGIELEGPHIQITGSPRDPRLAGTIRVQRGGFKLPGTRANFNKTTGTIDFNENERASEPDARRSSPRRPTTSICRASSTRSR